MPSDLGREFATALNAAKSAAVEAGKGFTLGDVAEVYDAFQLAHPPKRKTAPIKTNPDLPLAEWLKDLQNDPANAGLDVQQEWLRCSLWVKGIGEKVVSRKRFINWLLKADKQLSINRPPSASKRVEHEPPRWRQFVQQNYPDSVYAQGGDQAHKSWAELPPEVRQKFIKEML